MPWSSSSSPSRRSDVMRPPRSGRISMVHRLAVSLTVVIALAACSSKAAQVQHTPSYSPPTLTLPSPEPSPTPTPSHVFVIVLENRSYAQVVGSGFIAQLAQQYAFTSDYHGVSHPSLPNYLALTSGRTYGTAGRQEGSARSSPPRASRGARTWKACRTAAIAARTHTRSSTTRLRTTAGRAR